MLSLIGEAIAQNFGPSCEVVVHDLRKPGRSIVAIFNGHVTGRKVGDGIPDHDLYELPGRYRDQDLLVGWRAHTTDGRRLRSTTIFLRDSSGHPFASLGINVDLSLVERVHAQTAFLLQPDSFEKQAPIGHRRVSHLLRDLIDEATSQIHQQVSNYGRADRVFVARYLDERGAFVIRGSVASVARQLGVSRMAMYSYIEEARRLVDGAEVTSLQEEAGDKLGDSGGSDRAVVPGKETSGGKGG